MSDQAIAPAWPLETERLVLRPFGEGDLDALYAIHSDAENVRYLYNGPRDGEEVRALLGRKIDGAAVSGEGDWLSAAVVLRQTGELIGDCSLQWVSREHRQGEVGFIFNRACHGRGYATEGARAVLGIAFDDLRLHRVVGRLEPRNTASARVLERLGMRCEAHLIENEFVKGEWQSELIYALLESEWRTRLCGSRMART